MRNELLLWLQVDRADRADRVVAVRGGFEYKSENDIINYWLLLFGKQKLSQVLVRWPLVWWCMFIVVAAAAAEPKTAAVASTTASESWLRV